MTLSDWLTSAGSTLSKAAEYLAVGALAIGVATAAVALMPAEVAATAAVLIVLGTNNAITARREEDEPRS
jgi:hypothetical protein